MCRKKRYPDALPKYTFNHITDITVNDIKAMGGKGVGIDIDNTTAFDATYNIFDGVTDWIDKIRAAGIPVMIISNTYTKRARIMSERFGGIPWIARSGKPDPKNYIAAAGILGIDISGLIMIGDQLFTDIQGANSAGAISVRVMPVKREILFGIRYRILRRMEKDYLRRYSNNK